jgi:protocatechuate 4,5-dioxygenase alpha chain
MIDTGIPGTILFDGRQAMKGYALNKMCYSLNAAANREEYRREQFGAQQRGMTEQAFKDMLVRGAAGAGGKP